MKNTTIFIYCLFAILFYLGCGDVHVDNEHHPSPLRFSYTNEIEEDYDTSGILYKLTYMQIDELLKLDYPNNWSEEEDLELQARYYHAMLIQKYGDIPAVHIVGIFNRLILLADGKPIQMSNEDHILVITAYHSLWPSDAYLKALNSSRRSQMREKTDDPLLFVELYTEELIEQHGDIPEVHIVVDGERKMRFGGFQIRTVEDKEAYIEFLNAKYVLQPTDYFLCILNAYKKAKEDGIDFHLVIHGCDEDGIEEYIESIIENVKQKHGI